MTFKISFHLTFFFIFFNFVTNTDYYVSTSSGDDDWDGTFSSPFKTINKATYETTLNGGDVVHVFGGTYFECVKFSSLSQGSEAEGYITLKTYQNEKVTVDGIGCSHRWYGNIRLNQNHFTKISGFHVRNSAGYGITSFCSNNVIIENNNVFNTSSSGIWVQGDWCISDDDVQNSNIIIRNNTINEVNMRLGQEALSLSFINNFEIVHNKVYNSLKETLDVKYGCSNGIVAYNTLVNNWGYLKHPGGTFNHPNLYIDSWTHFVRNVSIFRNHISGPRMAIALATERGGVLENIYIYENFISVTDQSAFVIVHYDVPGTHIKGNIQIYNNFLMTNKDNSIVYISEPQYYFYYFYFQRNIMIGPDQNIFSTSGEAFSPNNLNYNFFFKDNIANHHELSWNDHYIRYHEAGCYETVKTESLFNDQQNFRLKFSHSIIEGF